jgi:tyrosine-protein phosphatase SIW14
MEITTRGTGPRRSHLGRSLVFALVIAILPRQALAVTITPEAAGIDNFGQVNTNYFRGAQPDQAGFQRLNSLGIRTVIDLQEDGKREEPGWVEGAGMQYFRIPLSSSHPATAEETAQFLELVNDPKNWPVYVHCAGGRHRTGEMTGVYRITHDAWTADQAFEEMRHYDYYSFPNHGSLRDYVYKYYDTYRVASARRTLPAASADSSNAGAMSAAAPAASTP